MRETNRPSGTGRLLGRVVRTLGEGVAALLGLVLLAAASGILLASQTSWGRAWVGELVEEALRGPVDGRVEVGPVTGGNLVTRAVIERFAIADAAGRPFLELRDVRVEYSPLSLLTGDYHLRRMRAGSLDLRLDRDREGGWNYQRIFGGEEAAGDGAEADGARLWLTDATVEDARVEVREPWSPSRGSEDAETVWRVEPGEDGPERVVTLEGMSGSLPLVRLVDPARPLRIEATGVAGRLRAVRQELELERLDATATFGDTIRVELPAVATAASRLAGDGRVVPGDPTRFRFDLDADPLAFEELRWLPVPVPAEGGGEGRVTLRTAANPEIVAVEVGDGSFRAGSSRAAGRFTLYLEETPRLEDVSLELRPLELALYRRLTGAGSGPDGWVAGTVAGAGPLDRFRIDASLSLRRPGERRFAAAPGGVGPGRADTAVTGGASRVELDGGVGLQGEPRALRDLRIRFRDFEPRWTRLIGVDTRQGGRVEGRATLDRTPAGRVAFEANLRHSDPPSEPSRVVGSGSFRPGDPPVVDLRVRAEPLSLSVLDPWFPALDLMGMVRGPFSLDGPLSGLDARADLTTPRGRLEFDGRFDLVARRRAYDARITAREIQLQQWIREGPRTRLDVTGRVRGRGTNPDSLEATFDLEVLPSTVQGARVDTSLLRFTVREGMASVDTFAVRSDVGTLRGRGGIGLGTGETGSLFLELEAPELSTWNRWLVPGRLPAGDTVARDLFARFPAEEPGDRAEGEPPAVPDTLAGSLSARGVVRGNLPSFGFGGTLIGRGVRYGEAAADSVRVTADVADVRSLDSLVVSGRARGAGWGRQRADSATFRLVRTGGEEGRVRLAAHRRGRGSVAAGGRVRWSGGRREARLDSLELRTARQRLRLAGVSTVARGDSGLSVRDFELTGTDGARLRVDGTVPDRGPARLDLSVRGLDVGGLARMAWPELPVRGVLSGSGRLRGTVGEPTLEAELRVEDPGWRELAYDSVGARLDYADDRLSGRVALHHGGRELVRVDGTARADLALREVGDRMPEDPLSLTVAADSLPLDLLLAPTESLREVSGHAAGRVDVRGSPGSPLLQGELEVRQGSARAVAVGIGLREIGGRIRFEGAEARLDSLGLASSRGGRAVVRGTVGLAELVDPSFDLELVAHRLHAIDRRRASLKADGRGHLGGSYRRPELTGRFRLSDGTVRIREFLQQGQVVDLTDPELYGLLDTTAVAERRVLARVRDPFMQNLKVDVDVPIGPDLWVRSPELNVEVAGDLEVRMDRAQDDLAAAGQVRLVRGTYRFQGARGVVSRQLRITEGRIEFVGTPGGNPNLDITAVHRVRRETGTIRVEARITGTMTNPSLSFSSDPPLSESDQVCVLLINARCGAPGTGELARNQLLGRVSAELSSVLASQVGFDYLELRGGSRTADGEDGGDPASGEEGSFFARAEVEAGWYLSPEVFLTVTYPVGHRFPAGSLDWRFSDDWSLELLTELRLNGGLRTGAASNLERERTWGLFLFREWSF